MSAQGGLSGAPANFEIEMPAGGKLPLQTIEEVDLIEESRDRYLGDFKITQQSDKLAVGSLLVLHLEVFRAQQRINGMEPEVDANGVPTGLYKRSNIKGTDRTAAFNILLKSQQEIRDLEKSLGIDKKTRDAGGQYDVQSYVDTVKGAAREYGIHLSKRYVRYEKFVRELRVKLRMLDNLDAEDLQQENLTPDTVFAFIRAELVALEDADKKFAHEKGKLIVGRVR